MIRPSKRYSLLITTVLLSFLLTACGSESKEGATNEWVVTNPETESPYSTESILSSSDELVFAGLQKDDEQVKSLLTAYDLEGNILWQADEKTDVGYDAIIESAVGGYIVAGGGVHLENNYPKYSQPVVAKYSSLGEELWSTILGEQAFSEIKVGRDDNDQSYVYTKNYIRDGANNFVDFSLSKVDATGNILWNKQFRENCTCWDTHFAVDSMGNSYLAYALGSGPLLTQFDSEGNQQWQFSVPSDGDLMPSIETLFIDQSDRAVMHTTISKQVIPNFIPPTAAATYAFTTNGAIAWEYHLPAVSTDYKLDVESGGITIDANGNYYLAHSSSRQDFAVPCPFCEVVTYKLYLTKLTPDGNELWHQSIVVNPAGASYVSVNDEFVALINKEYIRAFNPENGELIIQQESDTVSRNLTNAYITQDSHFYLVSDAGTSYNRNYQIEKWVRNTEVTSETP